MWFIFNRRYWTLRFHNWRRSTCWREPLVPLLFLRQHWNVDLYGGHSWAGRVAVACVAGRVALRRSVVLRGRVTLRGGVAVGLSAPHLRTVAVWSGDLSHVHLRDCWGYYTLCVALRGHVGLGVDHSGRKHLWGKWLRPINWRGRVPIGGERLGGQRGRHGRQRQPERRRQLFTHAVPHEHQQCG